MTEMVMDKKEQATATSFGKRNANVERIAREEEEIKQLLSKQSGNADDSNEDNTPEPADAEERSFKKRYGDLRRHSQQQQTAMQKQLDDLQGQLHQSTEQQIKFPKTEEELAAWANSYPDVARIVETIAMKKAKEQNSALEERFKALDEREKTTARDKAENELMKAHPDFTAIRDSDEFHDWVDEQPKWVQDALYNNDTDSRSASRAIDLYKADKNIGKPAKRESNYNDAAKSVNVRSAKAAPSGNDAEGVYYESQVNKMSIQQYEQHQAAIDKSIKAHKFVYDISGSARQFDSIKNIML